MKKVVVLSGAGISAESGIKTFRDAGGLWEGHDVMEVASPEGWRKNPHLVLDFYNQRRKQLKEVLPVFSSPPKLNIFPFDQSLLRALANPPSKGSL